MSAGGFLLYCFGWRYAFLATSLFALIWLILWFTPTAIRRNIPASLPAKLSFTHGRVISCMFPSSRNSLLIGLATSLLLSSSLFAQDSAVRPKITGISHVGYFVSDLPKAIGFWHDFLGFDEAYTLAKKDSSDIRIAFIKINDHQHIELFNEPP